MKQLQIITLLILASFFTGCKSIKYYGESNPTPIQLTGISTVHVKNTTDKEITFTIPDTTLKVAPNSQYVFEVKAGRKNVQAEEQKLFGCPFIKGNMFFIYEYKTK